MGANPVHANCKTKVCIGRLLVTVASVAMCSAGFIWAAARTEPTWQGLVDWSELVVVARVLDTAIVGVDEAALQTEETRFTVKAVLKGRYDIAKPLVLQHHAYVGATNKFPFPDVSGRVLIDVAALKGTDCLLFLQRASRGRFRPATDTATEAFSVYRLQPNKYNSSPM